MQERARFLASLVNMEIVGYGIEAPQYTDFYCEDNDKEIHIIRVFGTAGSYVVVNL